MNRSFLIMCSITLLNSLDINASALKTSKEKSENLAKTASTDTAAAPAKPTAMHEQKVSAEPAPQLSRQAYKLLRGLIKTNSQEPVVRSHKYKLTVKIPAHYEADKRKDFQYLIPTIDPDDIFPAEARTPSHYKSIECSDKKSFIPLLSSADAHEAHEQVPKNYKKMVLGSKIYFMPAINMGALCCMECVCECATPEGYKSIAKKYKSFEATL